MSATSVRYCTNCGTQVLANMRVCTRCGSQSFSETPISQRSASGFSDMSGAARQGAQPLSDSYRPIRQPTPHQNQTSQSYAQGPSTTANFAHGYPAGAAPAGQPAGFWIRTGALLIDGLILLIPNALIFAFFGVLAGGGAASAPSDDAAAGLAALASLGSYGAMGLLNWLYFAISESSSRHGTFGKRAVGIGVFTVEMQPVSFGRATGRYFAKALSGMIIYIGFIMAGFTRRKQALHDMIASTVVVRIK